MIDGIPMTDVYESASSFRPESGSAYLYKRSVEERSVHVDSWRGESVDVRFVEIDEDSHFGIVSLSGKERIATSLRSFASLRSFWEKIAGALIYIDITGLSHHVWAPLLRSAIHLRLEVVVVYVEPSEYKPNEAPVEGQIFDLSERIEGIAPLPGFAFLGTVFEEDVIFVPLLGFEGTRFAHMLEQVQPGGEHVIPVIGVPGFRLEYPFHTFLGNKRPLEQTRAWERIRFATANCPFSALQVLEDILRDVAPGLIQVAPIGTKPHAVGAILFSMRHPQKVELVYDFPLRKSGRTRGSDRLLAYYVSGAVAS